MDGFLRVPRSRGAMTGVLIVLLGAWGALIPLIGPYFSYSYTPATTWDVTSGRLWMEIVPGVVAVLGGLILLASTLRPASITGSVMAAAAGAWFVLGNQLRPLWSTLSPLNPGSPAGTVVLTRVVEQIGFFSGLGVILVFLAGLALGRHAVLPGSHRRTSPVEEAPQPVAPAAS